MKVEFNIDDEELNKLLLVQLQDSVEMLTEEGDLPFFSNVKKEEKRMKKKLVKALKTTIAWYSVGGNVEEFLK